jgi:hypothetical protein
MTEPNENADEDQRDEPDRQSTRWRYGPVRLISPWIAVAAGIFFVIRGTANLPRPGNDGTTYIIVGVVLIVVGVIGFFVARWMAKRGI